MPVPHDIYPEDSWVLDVWSDEGELALVVEAALTRPHPCFYSPPKRGETHAYSRILIRLQGEVRWHDGPRAKRTTDTFGEQDYGDLGSWWTGDDGCEHVEGEWGHAERDVAEPGRVRMPASGEVMGTSAHNRHPASPLSGTSEPLRPWPLRGQPGRPRGRSPASHSASPRR